LLEGSVGKAPEMRDCKVPEDSGFKVLIDVVSKILESVARKMPFGGGYKIMDRSE